ncbi:MAG: NAD-dependent epimerase/dehydratase family protein [Anaerolineaceae bacterium]|nr:NAD-dependent epimerase/dehydratase family protein [Anaerolineaceae bacterium]
MKVLFIGGTGTISTAVSRLAIEKGIELYHLNRGQKAAPVAGVKTLIGDIHQPESLKKALEGQQFDVVVDWIAFKTDDIERDLMLFRGKVKQFIFISSASAYQKPVSRHIITESTPLYNPYWEYSRNKIACEDKLMAAYRDEDFPMTIVRPSHTYDHNLPLSIGSGATYTVPDRIKKGLPVVVHGDGTSLWVVTHSEDFARGFIGLLGNLQAIGHAFHITTDEVLTWNQIYETLADALGVKANVVHISSEFIAQVVPDMGPNLLGDKAHSVVFDNSKIKAFVPEFKAVIPFREGVRQALGWLEADENRLKINDTVNEDMDRILAAYGKLSG